jgi:hypothetical protein
VGRQKILDRTVAAFPEFNLLSMSLRRHFWRVGIVPEYLRCIRKLTPYHTVPFLSRWPLTQPQLSKQNTGIRHNPVQTGYQPHPAPCSSATEGSLHDVRIIANQLLQLFRMRGTSRYMKWCWGQSDIYVRNSCLLFCMPVKLGLLHSGKNRGWRCSRTGCCDFVSDCTASSPTKQQTLYSNLHCATYCIYKGHEKSSWINTNP